MTILAAVTILASLAGGSVTALEARGDIAVIKSNSFRMAQSKDGHCIVINRKTGRSTKSALRAPCRFLRRAGKVQWHHYAGFGRVFYIVAAPSPMGQFAQYPSIKSGDLCSESAQALILSKSGGLVLRSPEKAGLYCPAMGLDEKDFYASAHQKGL
jgi:hypothetical protein